MKTIKKIVTLKKRIIELDFDKINEDILYLINEARTSPQNFLELLNINDTEDKDLQNLINYFYYSSKEVPPLILDQNISICSKDLLEHIIYSEKHNEESKNIESLKRRIRKLNLIPTNYGNFIILDANDPNDVIINLFLNDEYRMKILNPELKYIGISSGLFDSGSLCIIIDIAQSLKSINNNHDENEYRNLYKNDFVNPRIYKINNNYIDNESIYKKRIFRNKNNNKNQVNNNIIKLNKDLFLEYKDYKYKYPISVCIKEDYIKDECGNVYKIYNRESKYDDGTVLIQPDIDF